VKRPEFKLLHTTAVRLAIKSILLYGLLLSIVLAALYWVSGNNIDKQIENELQQEISGLQQIFNKSEPQDFIKHIERLQQQKDHIYYFNSADGKKLAGNLFDWPEDVDIKFDGKTRGLWVNDEVIPIEIHDDDAYWPVVATEFSDGSQLLIARNVEQPENLLELSEFLIEAMGIALLFAVLIAILLGQKILRRIDVISATASEIMLGDLAQRIPVSNNNDEFDALASQLNAMLDRIQQLIKGIRDVTDNIAHDLRSPLTRIRNQMEITLLESRSTEEYQKVLRSSINEVESLVRTFNALLSIAQTEAGNHRTLWSKINVKHLAKDLMDLYTPLCESKGQTLELINGENSFIYGSRDLLAQSFGNLIENAIKFTTRDGHIKLHILTSDKYVEVIVADTGPGIADAAKKHVLEKFVRLEGSRQTHGNGLGLSLVSAVAGLHKAELVLKDNNPGLQVVQRFPKID